MGLRYGKTVIELKDEHGDGFFDIRLHIGEFEDACEPTDSKNLWFKMAEVIENYPGYPSEMPDKIRLFTFIEDKPWDRIDNIPPAGTLIVFSENFIYTWYMYAEGDGPIFIGKAKVR